MHVELSQYFDDMKQFLAYAHMDIVFVHLYETLIR